MRVFFKPTFLALAVSTVSMTAYGAGLDRSGQDITAFLQDGTYAEAVYTYIDADVSGYDNANVANTYTQGNATGDIAEAYDFFRWGVKADINDTFSLGVLYDEPFGAAVQYFGGSNFVAKDLATVRAQILPLAASGVLPADKAQSTVGAAMASPSKVGQGTNVEIRTNNVTMLLGAKLGANKNFQIYGGPAAQRLTGEVHLRGVTYQGASGYDAKISTDQTLGWVAGVAYSKPEIALRASLTYRSETEHESDIAEVFPLAPARGFAAVQTQNFSVTLPESYNLDFQTGISPTMLLTAKARYVPWSKFSINPTLYTQVAQTPIVDYSKDQWSGELGLAKKLNDKVVVSGNVGYDSGAGNPVSTLGPIEGYYSFGLGARYNITPEWSVSLGGKYLKFGDATAQLPNRDVVGKFPDNDGYIVGLKLAYHSK